MSEPAKTIIQICGGYAATARLAKRSEVRVRRWEYPKSRGGTGGLVPSDCQQDLLDAAREAGIDLRPSHFFREAGLGAVPHTPSEDAA